METKFWPLAKNDTQKTKKEKFDLREKKIDPSEKISTHDKKTLTHEKKIRLMRERLENV